MSEVQYGVLGDVFYFHMAVNDTSGSASDATSPVCHVRLCGAASSAAPIYSPTPAQLSDATYNDGLQEVSITGSTGNGFAADSTYAVFVVLVRTGGEYELRCARD